MLQSCCGTRLCAYYVFYLKGQIGVHSSTQKKSKSGEKGSLKPKPMFRSHPRELSGSKSVPICHHYGVIGHIRPQCFMLKKEQNHGARSLPKKPSGPKHTVCHHCGAIGHLRPHCSKFQALKRIKRKEKLELFGRNVCLKAKPDLGENCMLLKQVGNALISLSMCISGSHSSNLRLTSHETLIPHNHSVWMRKDSYG